MTARMLLANIVSFGLQITMLVAAGAALARAFRIDDPRAMLAYWRTLLLACILLPLCQPWNITVPPTLIATAWDWNAKNTVVPAQDIVSVASSPIGWPITDLVLMALAAGIAARLSWLTIGAFGLRRLRRGASPLDPVPDSVQRAHDRIGARARLCVSTHVAGPITFGLFRPLVVFPPSVSTLPAHVQEAITCHELLHVQRRDWLYEIVEEAIRSVLWFYPAIWWLIGRIRLAREQVVDEAVVRLTDSRERYVEALLAIALAGSPVAFTPASPFLRRHLLKRRVARILQETTMTTRRLIASLIASTALLAVAATFAVRSFPLEAQGRAPADTGQPVQLVRGGEHLLHGDLPGYPRRAVEQKVEGDVVVEMTLNDRGEVADARVVSGPEELRKPTLEAVLQWHFSPTALRSTDTQATFRFQWREGEFEKEKEKEANADYTVSFEPAKPTPGNAIEPHYTFSYFDERRLAGKLVDVEINEPAQKHTLRAHNVTWKIGFAEEPPLGKLLEGSPRLVDIQTERVTEATATEVLAQAGVGIGDAVNEDTAKRIRQAAAAVDEHIHVGFDRKGDGLIITIVTR